MSRVLEDSPLSEEERMHLPVLHEKEDPPVSIRLSGTAITEAGKLTKHKYFEFLHMDLDDYSDLEFTPEEAKKIRGQLAKMSTGATSMTPQTCSPRCPWRTRCVFYQMNKHPIGRACHPPGEKILTAELDYVPIEELDPDIHTLSCFDRRRNAIKRGITRKRKKGYTFKKGTRQFSGTMVKFITESGKEYNATEDHICIARWNEKAVGKFCVYLMRKGEFWRVGKSQILGQYKKNNRFGHKNFIAFSGRGNGEKADAMWILGVYDTNTDATLAEDYFSCSFQTSKTLFIATSDNMSKHKWDGLYAWATQEQLDNHHKKFIKPEIFYKQKLAELGLSIDYPIWTPGWVTQNYLNPEDGKLLARGYTYIRACNVLSGIMEMPTLPKETEMRIYSGKRFWMAEAETVIVEKQKYDGLVYSLDVERHHSYFVNDIATHNCIVETNLLREWTTMYFNEYAVDPNNFTEIGMINELAEIEVMQWRLNQILSLPENVGFTIQQPIGISFQTNEPIEQTVISPYLEAKDRLSARKTKLVKLMVGDRQEKYKREAALKKAENTDPSSAMSDLRNRLERLSRELKSHETTEVKGYLSADDLISGESPEGE